MVSASNFITCDRNTIVSSVNAFLPKIAVIPLGEEESFVDVLVSEGQRVKEGEIIAKAKNVYIHSSVPGIVQKVAKYQYVNGKQGLCAFISLNGSFNYLGKNLPVQNWQSFDRSTISYLIREAGIINTFSKPVPLFKQLKKDAPSSGRILALRLFDADPSYVTESFISKKFLSSVLEGAALIARAFGARACIVAHSSSEQISDQLNSFKSLFAPDCDLFSVPMDIKKYPAGTMHDIVADVKSAFNIDFFSKFGRKDLFINSITAYNTYKAIVRGEPLVSNFVHVTGDCLNSAAMLNLRIGTRLSDIVEQCGGFKRNLFKIIINGIMLGNAVSSLDIPIGRSVKSIEFMPVHQVKIQNSEICVRCGNCRKICPVHLWPGNLYRVFHLENIERACDSDKDACKSSLLCLECGLCNSVCPARLPLSQTISLLKESNNE